MRPWRNAGAAKAAAVLGVALLSVLCVLPASLWPPLAVFEDKSVDLRFRLRGAADRSGSGITVVYVDEPTLAFYRDTLGRWPWPREIFGRLVDYVAAGGPRAIVFDIFFADPDLSAPASDAFLARATARAGNVLHAMTLEPDGPIPPESLGRHALPVDGPVPESVPFFASGVYPLPGLVESARGIGVINYTADLDGPSRRVNLVYRLGGQTYPSLPLAAALRTLGSGAGAVSFSDGRLRAGSLAIPLDREGRFLVNWRGPSPGTYPSFSAGEIIDSILRTRDGEAPSVPPEAFRDRVVLIGTSAVSLYDLRVSPLSPVVPGVDLNAAVIDNLLHRDFLVAPGPAWTFLLAFLLALGVAAPVIAWRRAAAKLTLGVGLLVFYPVAAQLLFTHAGLEVPLVFPLAAGALSLTLSYVFSYASEGREKRRIRSALDRFVSHQVASEVARDPNILRLGSGERREITVLFSDIRGFTSLSERLSAEEVVTILTRYFSLMVEIVFRHGGTLDKFVGDAIMAVFGAPGRMENHAAAAARCALEMQEALAGLNREFAEEGVRQLAIGVGINTGEAVVGFMGSERRLEYTAIGDTVNLASRLESLTKEQGVPIIVSDDTLRRIGDLAEARELGPVLVKGKEQAVTVHALTGMRSADHA